ncbi:MAG: hypothetical protein ABF990_11195 [Acetobacter sp.]
MATYMREWAGACVIAGGVLLAVCLGNSHGVSLSTLSDATACFFRY